jgi:hypothetical protein
MASAQRFPDDDMTGGAVRPEHDQPDAVSAQLDELHSTLSEEDSQAR